MDTFDPNFSLNLYIQVPIHPSCWTSNRHLMPNVYSELGVLPRPQAVLTSSNFYISFPFIELLCSELGIILTLPPALHWIYPLSSHLHLQMYLESNYFSPPFLTAKYIFITCLSSLSPTSMQASWRWGLVSFITMKFQCPECNGETHSRHPISIFSINDLQ